MFCGSRVVLYPIADALHQWLRQQRQKVPDGSATAKAIDYSLKRWKALTRFIDDGELPIDNNWVENQIRPIALGRNNWLFAGSDRGGQWAAYWYSLLSSCRRHHLDPFQYLRAVLAILPTCSGSDLARLTPLAWAAEQKSLTANR